MATEQDNTSTLREQVRQTYAAAALAVARSGPVGCQDSGAGAEAIPLPDASVDVVISNCVINLSTDKAAVLTETFRVLKPAGRLGVTDIVADDHLSPAQRAERGNWAGCIAGGLSFGEYHAGLEAAGFTDIEITPTREAADGLHSAIIKTTKPPN